jgi:hypothetical protein
MVAMTADVCEGGLGIGDGVGQARLQIVQRDEERKMTDEEVAEMSLESLLYYVLVGEGRRSL